jgi:hypothetical protein
MSIGKKRLAELPTDEKFRQPAKHYPEWVVKGRSCQSDWKEEGERPR